MSQETDFDTSDSSLPKADLERDLRMADITNGKLVRKLELIRGIVTDPEMSEEDSVLAELILGILDDDAV